MRGAILVAILAAALAYPSGVGTVYSTDGVLSFKDVLDPSGVAYGNFTDQSVHPSGFGFLEIVTNSKYPDNVQARAAGLLEGVLTAVRIHEHYESLVGGWLMSQFSGQTSIPPKYTEWMTTQDQWLRQQIATNNSDWFAQISFIVSQFDGLVEGYGLTNQSRLSTMDFAVLNAIGDFLDLVPALNPSAFPDYDSMSPDELTRSIANKGHCSALVKVTGNYSDLFVGHSSWFTYSSMLRIYKRYVLNYNHPATATHRVAFSGYPGMLASLDDFYLMKDSNMAMVQTTNGIYNQTLYQQVTNQGGLAWQRVRLACQMANNGLEWSETIAAYNTGTYNNQYMVVDFKLFSAGAELPAGVLWVSEQIPGLVVYGDITQELERGYFPSYNVPYFPEIYEKSGYPTMTHTLRNKSEDFSMALSGLSYQLCPRAMIFRRDQGTVVDMNSFKTILRSNAYKTDPYAKGSPYGAICSRGDLAGDTGGCYDTKVTSASWLAVERADVLNGPTTAGNTLPPFAWTAQFNSTAHFGQPTLYNFAFETMLPNLSP